MKKMTVMIGVAFASFGLVACGGSDSSSSGLTDDQQAAASLTIQQAKDGGVELDESCVNGVAAQLSDDDAQKIVAAGTDGEADVSEEGDALSLELLNCAGQDAIIDLMVKSLNESGQNFDEDCVRENLADIDMAELATAMGDGDAPPEFTAALMKCVDVGG